MTENTAENTTVMWASIHRPILEQIKELNEMGGSLLLEIEHPKLLQKISNIPTDYGVKEMELLVEELIDTIKRDGISTLVQPAGSPAFQVILSRIAALRDVTLVYALSERNSVEVEIGGRVVKRVIFEHKGFITIPPNRY